MTETWRDLPAPARPIAAAATAAVAAVRETDAAALDEAVVTLAALPQTGLVLGTAVRVLLEDTHPDGLDGDDVRGVLTRCVTGAAWLDGVDPHVLLLLLAGALGVHGDDEDAPPPRPETLARHAALLTTDLLDSRELRPYLVRALAEIERAQIND